ncbi:MAG: succinylglutamate desuccinylase [Zetaproteobacteria bacterium CG12_big_fil_rev_8_21_14_0_65_55_1124]|nr:MAG: succinylglutamate desuccinylase [Zetaproteobacteria bacterium CG1_02_55_237]PIS19634.1 MAG: succinylglutamate desuccinylase [Zetaproteobacteria bacterium CG08_land_8_20_14_0_20_55_17]PIW41976.1 MAG: succinylglutamate desuccinylase [Zetaproteobacteria bacterium CG12_big_fil_rev_8_21_14_0_65_55_1124]PIY53854.1 MAG: succinylglutamate desuccinylase [Zetaproteobacteria bacterium CG_4_10_14_0_8_um_filter_55_43]PIZ37032.1 MAG: succinylglutamate desuccinylase [Zetaproteobacteria bacterium CG_4_
MSKALSICGRQIAPGSREIIEVPLPPLSTHSALHMPVHVIRGRREGPCLLVCAALHGDEINGIEIIRRLVGLSQLGRIRGTLIAIPIVNVYGFIHMSRYLPDRRDLNRSFPGSETGSLAGRLANLFMKEVVEKATYGIDLHTAAIHRDNFPQVRATLDDPETRRIAEAFHAPLVIDAALRPGTIREAAIEMNIPWLVYEAGEALRFDEVSIRAGVRGIVNVMREVGMLPKSRRKKTFVPRIVKSNFWMRAPQSGILRLTAALGASVSKGDTLGYVADPYGENEVHITAPDSGIIIGRTNLPLVHEGDAMIHLARFRDNASAGETVDAFQFELDPVEGSGLSGVEPIA